MDIGIIFIIVFLIIAFGFVGYKAVNLLVKNATSEKAKKEKSKLDNDAKANIKGNEDSFKGKPEKVEVKVKKGGKDDTIRKPISVGDRNYEKKIQKLEIETRAFFKNIIYPEGFKEFLDKYSKRSLPKYSNLIFGVDVAKFMLGISSVVSPENLVDENLKQIVFHDDYFSQFRKVVFFAYDGSGRGFYFIDYGKNPVQPVVKFLDSEQDKIFTLAPTFYEFKLMLDRARKR